MKKFLAFLLLFTFSFSFTEGIFANNNQNNLDNKISVNNIENSKKIIIYRNGVKINGKYYTKNEFENLNFALDL